VRHVALLRGINVGGKNKVPMADLARIFRELGATDVVTYINSGNVVFSHPAPTSIPAKAQAEIAKQLGPDVPVVLRSADALDAAIAANPLPVREPKHFFVGFLADRPTKAAIASLDPNRSPGDTFEVVGQDVFLDIVNPARTRLSADWFDRTLGTIMTMRNWRTTLELQRLCRIP
jgi:uncharacterized protein (DUF1697 family)